uniref:DUF4110 domain-containing protein n=1 Tax=Cyclophora tenuis TaxID=216820 RepID=A0A7S1GPI2_CYCTE|mmetsp:Transcript_4251/g.7354  ORF Transcript_4251/g.7354 Transcript_4251/m.7354 type:complete len:293 (+) Transcript_4251:167-1045(+)
MTMNAETGSPEAVFRSSPLPRIKAGFVVRGNVLYLFGGLLEVGDREVTLDDCWSLDLRKRDQWNCLWPGTMHKQVWRGAIHDDDDSYISGSGGGIDDDEDDDDEVEDDEMWGLTEEELAAVRRDRKYKAKQSGLRQEIAELKQKLNLDEPERTPQMGEAMADFYTRTSTFWTDQAAKAIATTAAAATTAAVSEIDPDVLRIRMQMAWEQWEDSDNCDVSGNGGVSSCGTKCKDCCGVGTKKCRFCSGATTISLAKGQVEVDCPVCQNGIETCRSCAGTGWVAGWTTLAEFVK